jgi:hypothetical protein
MRWGLPQGPQAPCYHDALRAGAARAQLLWAHWSQMQGLSLGTIQVPALPLSSSLCNQCALHYSPNLSAYLYHEKLHGAYP